MAMSADPRHSTTWWTRERLIEHMGAEHVAWVLSGSELPATDICRSRQWGAWNANNFVSMAAYEALGIEALAGWRGK